MDHIGIDVHKRESQIYILAEGGEVIERRIRTEPERFAAVLGARPRARIVIEASTDSEWVARCLEALGHEVVADGGAILGDDPVGQGAPLRRKRRGGHGLILSQIYILAEGGEVIEQRIRAEQERFAAVLGSRPRARVLIEASTDSGWVARCLEALGREVIIADPNFAPMYAIPPLESPQAPASASRP